MKRKYELTLHVETDEGKSLFDDHISFTTFDGNTAIGEVNIVVQLERMLKVMFDEYFKIEKTRVDYWRMQIAICKDRLNDPSLTMARRRVLHGALKRFQGFLITLLQEQGNGESGSDRAED